MTQTSIDRTILRNTLPKEKWRCPHCGRVQTLDDQDMEILMRYMRFIRHCENCGYLHSWELQLTDDFKRKVVDMVVGWARGERREDETY